MGAIVQIDGGRMRHRRVSELFGPVYSKAWDPAPARPDLNSGLAPLGRLVTTASNIRQDSIPDAMSGPPDVYHLQRAMVPDARPSHGRVGPGARIASSGPILPEHGGLSPPRTASLRSAGPVNCLMPAHPVRPCDAWTGSVRSATFPHISPSRSGIQIP